MASSQQTQVPRRSSIGSGKFCTPPASSPIYILSGVSSNGTRSPCLSPVRCIAPRPQRPPNSTKTEFCCVVPVEGPETECCPVPRPVPYEDIWIGEEDQVEGVTHNPSMIPGLPSPFTSGTIPPYLYTPGLPELTLEPQLEETVSDEIRSIFTCGPFEQSPRVQPVSVSTTPRASSNSMCECVSPPTRTQNPVVMDLRFSSHAISQGRHELPFMVLESPLLYSDTDGGVHSLAGAHQLPEMRGIPIPNASQRRRWSEDHSAAWPRLGTSC